MEYTLGNLVDKLTIANIGIWMQEDIKRDPDATDEELADTVRKCSILNQRRSEIIEAIDELIADFYFKRKKPKIDMVGSTKNYGKK